MQTPCTDSGHILLTGITGMVGRELVRCLLRDAPGYRVTALLRAASDEEAERRWAGLMRDVDHEGAGSWTGAAGDVTLPGLGLGSAERARLETSVTHVIHGASDVRFLAPIAEARATNVGGTRNVLDFALRCRQLRGVAHLSTSFVAGRREGQVLEAELRHEAGFVNTYEQSKYEAELVVGEFQRQIPIAVYRLALLPGCASDGYVHSFGSLHMVLYFCHRRMLEWLPGAPDNRVDMAPADWAAAALIRLFLCGFEGGRTYQIGSGRNAVTMREFVELVNTCFPSMRKDMPISLVDTTCYDTFAKVAAMSGKSSARMMRVLGSTTPHSMLSKTFDDCNVRSVLGEGHSAPPFRSYFPGIARYCLASRWGRQK